MANATADPDQQEDAGEIYELEQKFNAPSVPEKTPVSADDLEAQFNLPDAPEPITVKGSADVSTQTKTGGGEVKGSQGQSPGGNSSQPASNKLAGDEQPLASDTPPASEEAAEGSKTPDSDSETPNEPLSAAPVASSPYDKDGTEPSSPSRSKASGDEGDSNQTSNSAPSGGKKPSRPAAAPAVGPPSGSQANEGESQAEDEPPDEPEVSDNQEPDTYEEADDPEEEPEAANDQEDLAPADTEPIYDEPTGIAPSAPPGQQAKTPGREDLKNAEESAGNEDQKSEDNKPEDLNKHENQVGRGYKKQPEDKGGLIHALTKKRSRRFWAFGSIFATIIVSGLIFLFSLLPLKVVSMMENIQGHFGATSQLAVQKETDALVSGYLKRNVLPGLKRCGGGIYKSTVDKTCSPLPITDTSIVGHLYSSWRTARIENTLADKYHTEFRYNARSGRYYVKSPYLNKDVDISDFAEGNKALLTDSEGFSEVSGPEFQKFVAGLHSQLEDLTRAQEVMYRFKMNAILKKYGNWSRCIVACDTRTTFKDKVSNKKRAAKIKVIQRVVTPMSEQYSLIFQCVFAGCGDLTPGSGDPGLNGEPRSKAEVQLQAKLASLASEEGGLATLEAVNKANLTITEKGWLRYMMGEMFARAATTVAPEADAQAARELGQGVIGPVGWVFLSSQLIAGLDGADKVVSELGYAMNSAAFAQMYITYQTYADETKSGHVDATEVGSFNDSLGPGAQCPDGGGLSKTDQCNNGETQYGGTGGAESSPLYGQIVGGGAGTNSLASLLGGSTALAATATDSKYSCDNGKPPAAGQNCSELNIGNGNATLHGLHEFLHGPVIGLVTQMADFINNSIAKEIMKYVGKVASGLTSAAQLIPGVNFIWGQMTDLASKLLQPVFSGLVQNLVKTPVHLVMSGSRTFEAVAGGGDVVMNDFGHHQLGGVELTDQQVADARSQQTNEQLQQYTSQPLLARLFDRNNRYSAVSRLALAMPSDKASGMADVASIFSNPFGKIGHSLASIFSFNALAADTNAQPDPFGITQYGYPSNDPVFKADPIDYWNQHCTDSHMTDAWNAAAAAAANSSPTYQAENAQAPVPGLADGDPTGTDPCLLIKTAVGSAGGLFNASLVGS